MEVKFEASSLYELAKKVIRSENDYDFFGLISFEILTKEIAKHKIKSGGLLTDKEQQLLDSNFSESQNSYIIDNCSQN